MTVEECLAEWAEQGPECRVSLDEWRFISYMRLCAANDVGYGWMQQVIEWEWIHHLKEKWGVDEGALGPLYYQKQLERIKELEDEVLRLVDQLEDCQAMLADAKNDDRAERE